MTDTLPPAARETVGDDQEVVYVKHVLFTYQVPLLDGNGEQITVRGKRGQERAKYRTVHKKRYEAILLDDIPEEELTRGEEMGAFFTEAELDRMRNRAADGSVAEGEDTTLAGSAEVPAELNYDDHDALVLWIKEAKPTAPAVVAAAQNDPDKAEALLDAEVEATGDQPRKSVKDPLEKIIQGT